MNEFPGLIPGHITGYDNYFEDFAVGQRFRHARGKTVTDLENVLITNMVMNTADAHFNEDGMKDHPIGQRIVFGGVTASIVIGLASQDSSDNAIAENGFENMKLLTPVVHGDTLYAYTEVRDLSDTGPDSGTVVFHHWGVNQRGEVVIEVDRSVEVRRRPAETAGASAPRERSNA